MNAGGAVGFVAAGAAVFAIFVALRQLELQRTSLDDQRRSTLEAHRLEMLSRLREAYGDLIAQATRLSIFIQAHVVTFTMRPLIKGVDEDRHAFYENALELEDALYPLAARISLLDPEIHRREAVDDMLSAFRDVCCGQFRDDVLSNQAATHWADLVNAALERCQRLIADSLDAETHGSALPDEPAVVGGELQVLRDHAPSTSTAAATQARSSQVVSTQPMTPTATQAGADVPPT
jgi:hypothetical protein